ncbi:MAG: hypothetical protein KAH21_11875, partial [Spirochaetaceae bacterium]|nr:hypothetical protein [Spirochaetaceae bacterium]
GADASPVTEYAVSPEESMLHQNIAIRRLFSILVVLLLGISVSAQDSSTDNNQKIIKLLEGYQNLMSIPLDSDVEDVAGYAWYICSQAIDQGFLRFTVDPVSNTLLQGARFHAEASEKTTHIIITTNLLNTWDTYPSTAYTILTGAFRDASNFFQDPPTWGELRNDPMELLFMKMDQYNVESLLIRDRLLPSGFLLSPYESYLLDSFEKDELASVILFLERFSLPVAQGMYDARLGFEGDITEKDFRDFINDLGKELLANRNKLLPGSEDNTIYPQAIAIHTWLEFSPYLIARIHNKNRQDNPLDFDQILEFEPDYTETRRLLEASRTRDMPLINHIAEETLKGFEHP